MLASGLRMTPRVVLVCRSARRAAGAMLGHVACCLARAAASARSGGTTLIGLPAMGRRLAMGALYSGHRFRSSPMLRAVGQLDQFAKDTFALETASVTHGAAAWQLAPELNMSEVRLDGLLLVHAPALLAPLAPPWSTVQQPGEGRARGQNAAAPRETL